VDYFYNHSNANGIIRMPNERLMIRRQGTTQRVEVKLIGTSCQSDTGVKCSNVNYLV